MFLGKKRNISDFITPDKKDIQLDIFLREGDILILMQIQLALTSA